MLSLTTLITCLFAGHGTLRGPDPALLGNALHLALVRPAWCVAVSWIIYACVSNNGGIVNKFLSLPVFRVMGRLTFGIFITHQVWILYTISTKWHRSLWFDEIDMVSRLNILERDCYKLRYLPDFYVLERLPCGDRLECSVVFIGGRSGGESEFIIEEKLILHYMICSTLRIMQLD